jgi:glycerol kinase
MQTILAIDQGTTNTKAVLLTGEGRVVAQASRPMQVAYPKPGWAEQSAAAIWSTVADVIADLVKAAGDHTIAAVAISNQRESIVLWDAATGEPVAPCVIWQCKRSSDRCAALREAGHEADVVARTGLGLDPMFPAAKLSWLLDNTPSAREAAAAGKLRAGTVDSWLVYKLTGGRVHATDHSNASRTQLFNLEKLCWDDTLCTLFNVPKSILPEVRSSDDLFGKTADGATALPEGTPIRGVIGDSHAAAFGHGISGPGAVKATMGTGSSLMAVTGIRVASSHGLSTTIAWSRGGKVLYALEGNIVVSGQTAAFAQRLLGVANETVLTELAATVPSSNGVTFVPALAGLGAPHWRDRARGVICGMTLGTTQAHVARAALEAITLQITDVLRAMEADLGADLPFLFVDGGASKSDFLMQLLADLSERPVQRGTIAELSPYGAGKMAAEALGIWAPPADETRAARFAPAMADAQRQEILSQWHAALQRTMFEPS